jgi:hypothetical protein
MTWHGHGHGLTSRTSQTQPHTTPTTPSSPVAGTKDAAHGSAPAAAAEPGRGTGRNFGPEGGSLDRPAESVSAAAAAAATAGGSGGGVGGGGKEKEKHSALTWFTHRDIPVLIESIRAPVAALSASVYTYMYSNTLSKAAAAATAIAEGASVEESEGGIIITVAS